jgi:metallo-beta-lactamase class B
MIARVLVLSLILCMPATAQQNAAWRQPFPAFKLIGNVYWVGTYDLSTNLNTTDAGHLLDNTGSADTVPLFVEGVERLGFDFDDV